MNELTHFIGGRRVKGVSGRFADGFRADDREGDLARAARLQGGSARRRFANAAAAQPAWAATNPQRRARVLDEVPRSGRPVTWSRWPNCWRESTARQFPTRKGDIQRGVEAVEFAIRRSASGQRRVSPTAARAWNRQLSMRKPLASSLA